MSGFSLLLGGGGGGEKHMGEVLVITDTVGYLPRAEPSQLYVYYLNLYQLFEADVFYLCFSSENIEALRGQLTCPRLPSWQRQSWGFNPVSTVFRV